MNEVSLRVQEIKQELSVPIYLLGSRLFYEAVKIFTTDYHTQITKGVYHELACRHNLTPKQVEARINGVLSYLWKNRDLTKYGISMLGRRPTPKCFLCTMAIYINKESEE